MSGLGKMLKLLYEGGQPQGAAEILHFRENVSAGPPTSSIAKHEPPPGAAIVEIVDANNKIIAMDTIATKETAPRSAFVWRGNPTTQVVVGHSSLAHQEFEADINSPLPFDLPPALRNKRDIGAKRIRVWWSCEKEVKNA